MGTHIVVFPNQRPQSLVWEQGLCTCELPRPKGLITGKNSVRHFEILGFTEDFRISGKILRFHSDFRISRTIMQDFQISTKLSARFPDFNEDFCKLDFKIPVQISTYCRFWPIADSEFQDDVIIYCIHADRSYFLDFFQFQCLPGCGYNLGAGTKRGRGLYHWALWKSACSLECVGPLLTSRFCSACMQYFTYSIEQYRSSAMSAAISAEISAAASAATPPG